MANHFYRLSSSQLAALENTIETNGGVDAISSGDIDSFKVHTVFGTPLATLGDIESAATAQSNTDKYIITITTGTANPVAPINMVDLIEKMQKIYATATYMKFHYLAL